jgi:hypothetical protein
MVPAQKNDLHPPRAARIDRADLAHEETDSHHVLRTEAQLPSVKLKAQSEANALVEVDTFYTKPPWKEIQRSKAAMIAMVSALAMLAIGMIASMSR